MSGEPDGPFEVDARGLPVARPPSPELVEAERRWLADVAGRSAPARALAYLSHGGPGYLQAALTLGGGSASASILAGAAFGYDLLWVAPLGMAMGVVVLSAVAHQTLSTGMRPFDAMRVHAGAFFAWGWAIGTVLASCIWHFAQYSLASALVVDLGDAFGAAIPRGLAGLLILVWAVVTAQSFGGRTRWTQWFDRILKFMVWGIVVAFGVVALRAGIDDPGAIWRGLTSFKVPADRGEASGLALVLTGIATAVGINMIFLYPYTLLARGWGREHRELARYDLAFGMFLPYVLATGLMIVAAANTIHVDFSGTKIGPLEASGTLGALLGPTTGRVLFGLGVLGMVLTTITLHMVSAGFAVSEMFKLPFGSRGYRLALLLPTPGVLGCFFWSDMSVWLAVPTSIVCGFLLPVAYLGFVKLQRSDAYLGPDRPRGALGAAWLGALVLATVTITAFFGWYLLTRGSDYLQQLGAL